ncbi:putative SCO1-involved in stabilization of Cox1p and Cox2p [Microstroma glucosiphilum]|uniref:Putative SCO1-involved in stabilization of Cox1p and Cox2p n=1 Tax=Pseudomicrostroma glucosiphilum TaxID=1684307 RepID=A0A316U9T6_9BASI|nr:putative SCO1-involved in stabilization of Cox1p and Cox2p [Pseudomicrostroma glucosiphilum]PWN21932.1 putative SCO1-involved in stabilization of Cox1p and Cox2p [Pseudomicrostroma glucosiphilum]
MTRLLRTSSLQAVAGPSTLRLQAGVGAAVLAPSQPCAKRSYGSLSRPPRIAPRVQPSPFPQIPRRFASSLPNEPSESEQREKAKDRAAVGPFNARAAALFIVTGVGLFIYFQHERSQVAARKAADTASAKVGRPRIGGPFELTMASEEGGYRVTHEDIEGAFSLIYFGFTNCPDICPEELDKMGEVIKSVDKDHGPIINPIFISCDPARDNLQLVSTYIADFHPRLVGLTGPYEAVKAACKSYRVYFSTPPNADPSGDYLVDHSIFFYLMDPEGRFVDAFGRSAGKEEVETKVRDYIKKWKDQGLPISKADLKERVKADPSRKVAA